MFATLYLLNFQLQAALRHQKEAADAPVGLIDGETTKAVLVQLNAAAARAGVTRGMTPNQGQARCLGLRVRMRVRPQEKLLDELLLQYAFTLAPLVEATAPGVCTVQFTGRAAGPRAAVARVLVSLGELGLEAQGGIAPSPDTSLLAAHLGRPLLQVEDAKDFLAPLPLETLLIS